MAVQPRLCRTRSETLKTGFLKTKLILKCVIKSMVPNKHHAINLDPLAPHFYMSRDARKPVFGVSDLGFPTRSDTNHAVQPQKMARALKLRIYKVQGLYYLCSKNKGTDQLRSYCAADLRLCFRICRNPVFS